MRTKQRSDRDLGTAHALNYFACPRAATPKTLWDGVLGQKPGVDGYATSEIAGKNNYNKIPKIFRGDEEGKGGKRKRKKSGRKGGREEDPSKQEENSLFRPGVFVSG